MKRMPFEVKQKYKGGLTLILNKDISFYKETLSKHSQLMNMYLSHNNFKMAKEQFTIFEPIFKRLNNEGEEMYYYTPQDFERDCKRFNK